MPISQLTARKPDTSIRLLNGAFLPMRINLAGGNGGFAVDKNTPLTQGVNFATVTLGYEIYLGFLPPASTLDALCNSIKDDDKLPNPYALTPAEMLVEFARKNLVPMAHWVHVPLPASLKAISPDRAHYWPQGVITESFIKGGTSIGLVDGSSSFLGDFGLVPLLEMSAKNLVDVVTEISFEKVDKPKKSYYISHFDYWEPTSEDKEATEHIKACRKWLADWTKENPEATAFPVRSDMCVTKITEGDLKLKGDGYALEAMRLLQAQAIQVFTPEQVEALPFPDLVAEILTSDNLALAPAAAADLAVSTIEVKPID